MFENEDMILPEDFEEVETNTEEIENDQPQSEEEVEVNIDEVEEQTSESTEEEKQVEIPQSFKVKFNKEDKEVTFDEAVPLIQMGLNYPKLQSRISELENDPRISFVENLAKENGMTVEDFFKAVEHQREQEELDKLVQNNIPEEYAKEILENKRFREELQKEKQSKAEVEKQNSDLTNFLDYFKEVNGRDFDSAKDEIPKSVWEANANGIPLRYAYAEHHNKELQTQLKQLKTNEKNKQRAPGLSTTTHGSNEVAGEDEFLAAFNSI